MIIELANLGATAKVIELELDPTQVDLEGEALTLTGRVKLAGEIAKVDKRADLRGVVSADASLDCSRCLEPVTKHLEFPFRAIFVDPADDEPNAESEVSDDALDESVAFDGKIDMAEVVREQLLLAMPEQLFCTEDCRGLCPKCGSDLNLIDCRCADDEIDPRWAALKSLK